MAPEAIVLQSGPFETSYLAPTEAKGQVIAIGRFSLLTTKQTSPYQADEYMSHTKQADHTKGQIGVQTDPTCPCVISTHIPIWKYLVCHTRRPYYAISIILIQEDVPKISVTLIPPPPYKENSYIPRIQVYSASLYKHQVFFFPRYVEKSLALSLQSS